MCTGLAAPYSKRLSEMGLGPEMITGWQMFLGGSGLLLAGVLGRGWLPVVSPAGIGLMVYLAALSSVAFTLWTGLLRVHPSSSVAVYNFLVPVFGTLLSGLFLNEQVLTVRNLTALALVCAGIVLINRKKTDMP